MIHALPRHTLMAAERTLLNDRIWPMTGCSIFAKLVRPAPFPGGARYSGSSIRPSLSCGVPLLGQARDVGIVLNLPSDIELVAEAIVLLEAAGVDIEAATRALAGGLGGSDQRSLAVIWLR